MALNLTSPAEAISEAGSLFSGLIVGAPSMPTFPEPPVVDIPDIPTLPVPDFSKEVEVPDILELTNGAVSGDGVFDKIMTSMNAHITAQYNAGLLGKSEVAGVYIAAIETTLPQAIQFLLAGQQSYWQAKLLQMQAQNAYLEQTRLQAELEVIKLNAYTSQANAYIAQVGALTAQTQYANGKLQLVATLQAINTSEFQEALAEQNYLAASIQTSNTLPGGGTPGGLVARELELKDEQITTVQKQQQLIDSQTNVQRAQTYDTNTDTTPVAGVIGTQKALYTQQIQSYQDDGKNKGVKLIADLWTSAKALDDSVESPGPLAGNLMMAMNKYTNDLGLPNAMVSPDSPATGAPSDDDDWYTAGTQ